MAYIEGFLIPVAHDHKDAYLAHARAFAPMLAEFGATRIVLKSFRR